MSRRQQASDDETSGQKWWRGRVAAQTGPVSYEVDVGYACWSRHTDQLLRAGQPGYVEAPGGVVRAGQPGYVETPGGVVRAVQPGYVEAPGGVVRAGQPGYVEAPVGVFVSRTSPSATEMPKSVGGLPTTEATDTTSTGAAAELMTPSTVSETADRTPLDSPSSSGPGGRTVPGPARGAAVASPSAAGRHGGAETGLRRSTRVRCKPDRLVVGAINDPV